MIRSIALMLPAFLVLGACVGCVTAKDYMDGEFQGALRLDYSWNELIWPECWPMIWASEICAAYSDIAKVSIEFTDEFGELKWKSFIPSFSTPYGKYDFVVTPGDHLFIPCYAPMTLVWAQLRMV